MDNTSEKKRRTLATYNIGRSNDCCGIACYCWVLVAHAS